MSLINDALRRAKETQQQASPPPPSPMQFRPIEPARHARYDFGLLMPAALAVVGLLALFFAWQWAQGRKSTEPRQVRALAPAAAQATIAPQPVSPSVAATAPAPAPAAQPTPPSQPHPYKNHNILCPHIGHRNI
jgi:hypothetical protein